MHRLFVLLAALLLPLSASATPAGYTYYEIGNPAATTPRPTSFGMMLLGGGGWPYDAWRWFLAKAGNGHIVIIRASGDAAAGEEVYKDIGGAVSVQTLIFDDRKAASDPKVLAMLDHADGIFIAGGDQANYVRFWKDSPIETALNAHVRKNRPIGGTSAGLAILGGAGYGAMDGGSIDSPMALADPLGPAVTMVGDFLAMPYLAHVVTDTHFSARNRLGRLIAFVAKVRATGDKEAVGLGVDEGSALCVDSNGSAKLYGPASGFAWLVRPAGAPGAIAGKPLDWAAVRITGVGLDGKLDLGTLAVDNAAFDGIASVKSGQVAGVPAPKRGTVPTPAP